MNFQSPSRTQMNKKVKTVLFLFLCLILTAELLPRAHLLDDTIYSKFSTTPPIFNGVIGEDWEDANAYLISGEEGVFDLFLKHDEDYFYVGVRVNDPVEDPGERIQLYFDEGDDGDNGSGSRDYTLTNRQEDCKAIDANGIRWDGFWNSPYWWMFPSTGDPEQINFEAAIDYHSDHWEAEFKIPFEGVEGDNDLSDLLISNDDVIGFVLQYMFFNYTYAHFPSGANSTDATTWLNLVFDNEAPTISNITYTPNEPTSEQAVTVTAETTDDASGVKKITLQYSTDDGVTWIDVSMMEAYTGVIPKQKEETTVKFKILATDNAGFTTQTEDHSYTVRRLIFGMSPLIFIIIVGILTVAVVGALIFLLRARKKETSIPIYCKNCGERLKPGVDYCPKCGEKVK